MSNPFFFKSEFWIVSYTGIKVDTLSDFIHALKEIEPASIFYHFYTNIFNYHYLPTFYPNSFSYWLYKNNYMLLAEKIAAIDPTDYYDIELLRKEIISILEKNYDEKIKRKLVPFYFRSAIREVIKTGYVANNFEEFIEGIKVSSINSLFYHLVTSKIEKKSPINDYSKWLIEIGEKEKAEKIEKLDIYSGTLYKIKVKILSILEE